MDWFINLLSNFSSTSQIIISLAIMFIFGYLFSKLARLCKLPNVTGYILSGIIIGPYCLNLIPQNLTSGMEFISDIALSLIAFSVGEFFKFDKIKQNGWKTVILTLCEGFLASILVFVVMFFVLNIGLTLSIMLSAIASATAPAATIIIVRQTNSKGHYVDNLLQVIALDNLLSLFIFSIAISVATIDGNSVSFITILMPILKNLGAIAVGVIFGFALKFLNSPKKHSDNRLIILLAILILFCGLCAMADISPLLGCMVIGTIYINFSKDESLFLQANYFSPPLLLLFFVNSGTKFNLSALFSTSSIISSPVWLIVLCYLIVRVIGKYSGAYLGSLMVQEQKEVKNYLGLALLPQASVAIGLSVLAGRAIGGEVGDVLQTIVIAASVIYEIVGPILVKFTLYLSKSYEVANVDKKKTKSIRIFKAKKPKKISVDEIKENPEIVEEKAFTEGGEYMNELYAPPKDEK